MRRKKQAETKKRVGKRRREKKKHLMWLLNRDHLHGPLYRNTVICCNLSVHVFINCVSMVTEVAVSRLEVAQRVTLSLTSTQLHPSLFLAFCLHFLSQLPVCHPLTQPKLPDRKRVGTYTCFLKKTAKVVLPLSPAHRQTRLCV